MSEDQRLSYRGVADRLARQARWGAAVAALLICLLPWAANLATPSPSLALAATIAALALVAAVLLAALLFFDAALFRLMASHADEPTALAAVDDILARMELKSRPGTPRPGEIRIAGARRYALMQLGLLAVGGALTIVVAGVGLV